MMLYVGYGTLFGVATGTAGMSLMTLLFFWRIHQFATATGRPGRPDIEAIFWIDGLFRQFKSEPIRMAFHVYIVPIILCGAIGFAIENLARLFWQI